MLIVSSNQRHAVKGEAEAIELCLSGAIGLDSEVVVDTPLGDRHAPLSHFPKLYEAACKAGGQRIAGAPRPPGLFAAMTFLFCLLGIIGACAIACGDPWNVRRVKALAGFIFVSTFFGFHCLRERRFRKKYAEDSFQRERSRVLSFCRKGDQIDTARKVLESAVGAVSQSSGFTMNGPVEVLDAHGPEVDVRVIVKKGVVERIDIRPTYPKGLTSR